MLNIPSLHVSLPNLDPVVDSASAAVENNRAPRAIKKNTPAVTTNTKLVAPAMPSHVTKPKPTPGQKVDSENWPLNKAGQRVDDKGQAIDKKGRRINERNQLINTQGQAINETGQTINARNQSINDKGHVVDNRGRLINDQKQLVNDKGQLVNTQGKLVDEKNRLVDAQNRLINSQGRIVNEQKQLIDNDGKRVNIEGYLIDKTGRPLDKDGHVARSMASAVLGNNEPHEQIAGLKKSLIKAPGLDAAKAAAPATPKPSLEGAAASAAKTDELIETGAIPSSPRKSQLALEAAASQSAGALATLPVKLAETAGTTATTEAIKAMYLPVPLAPATPASPSTVGGSSLQTTDVVKSQEVEDGKQQQVIHTAMDLVQVSAFETQNALIKLEYGKSGTALVPGKNWPKEPLERMDKLEELLDTIEETVKELADAHKVYFSAYLPQETAASGVDGLVARTDTLEKRLAEVKTARDKIEA